MQTLIFGIGRLSSLARYCLEHDSQHTICAYTVDRAYVDEERYEGLPVVPFENIASIFPPSRHSVLVPTSFRDMNVPREIKFRQSRALGYQPLTYVSSRASVWPDLEIGDNCMIYESTTVQPFSRIGDNVIVRSAVHLSHDCVIGDNSFIAAGAVLAGSVTVGKNCFIGVNATVRDDIRIADRCFIGAGAVVTTDTEENGVYVGLPARRVGDAGKIRF